MCKFGVEAKFGNHGAIDQCWTKEQQVDVLKHQLIMLNKIPQLRGIIPWVLMHFRAATRNLPKLQDRYNRKGLVSETGQKLAFDCFKDVYKRKI